MQECAQTDFETTELFGINDDRQWGVLQNGHCGVIGVEVEKLHLVTLPVHGPGSLASGVEDRFANRFANRWQDVRPIVLTALTRHG